ncbi:hypothetical protein BDV59DRAFT_210987 [Aspergillus ambiguus]|uniref:questin oxidase family protein n=1 Tax=Aspergillus ambiguus TaxID=176160 RepID=UPI003CCDD69F
MSSQILKNTHIPASEAVRLPQSSSLQNLEPAFILDVTATLDERGCTVRKLLDNAHLAVAPLREPKLILHSHLPHLLGSAYFLGASREQLEKLYTHEISTLVHVDETFIRGGAIDRSSWREFLAQKPYTVAYVEFFDGEVKRNDGNWKEVLEHYLFYGKEPLINGFIGGLAHPFIHLAYAWELQSASVATEALSLGCTEYIPLHTLLDEYPPDNSMYKTTSLADVIKCVHDDKRFDGLFEYQGITNVQVLLQERYDALLEHWNAWEVTDPLRQLEQCCDTSVLLAIGTGNREQKYDFYLIHTMTVAHALRVLWHFIPEKHRAPVLRQYALFTIMVYICQLRPDFDIDIIDRIHSVSVVGIDWDTLRKRTIGHKWYKDSHFFKVVRAPKVFEDAYNRKDYFYLQAAAKFVAEFDGWEGFGLGVEGFLPNRDGYVPE